MKPALTLLHVAPASPKTLSSEKAGGGAFEALLSRLKQVPSEKDKKPVDADVLAEGSPPAQPFLSTILACNGQVMSDKLQNSDFLTNASDGTAIDPAFSMSARKPEAVQNSLQFGPVQANSKRGLPQKDLAAGTSLSTKDSMTWQIADGAAQPEAGTIRSSNAKTRDASHDFHISGTKSQTELMTGAQTDSQSTRSDPVELVVERQETHFAPAIPSLPNAQIARAILSEFSAPEPSSPVAAPKVAAKPLTVMHSLELSLEPPDLGVVTVRLSLRGQSLSIHLATGRPETLMLIDKDQASLLGALQSAGYIIDELISGKDFVGRDFAPSASGSDNPSTTHEGGKSQGGGQSMDQPHRQGQDGPSRDDNNPKRIGSAHDQGSVQFEKPPLSRAGGSIYV